MVFTSATPVPSALGAATNVAMPPPATLARLLATVVLISCTVEMRRLPALAMPPPRPLASLAVGGVPLAVLPLTVLLTDPHDAVEVQDAAAIARQRSQSAPMCCC